VTPAPALSFDTLAFTCTAGPDANCVVNALVIITETGAVISKSNTNVWLESVVDVAVSVAEAFNGGCEGGVYIVLVVAAVPLLSVPHAGAHGTFATDKAQVTGMFEVSVTGPVPACTL